MATGSECRRPGSLQSPRSLRLVRDAPGRNRRPGSQRVARPLRRFVFVAEVARVRDFEGIGFVRRDEPERVSVNHGICRAFRFNRGHVASDALTACASFLVVRVFLDGRCSWTVR